MDIDKYLPTPEMRAEFERFKMLKTQEEKVAFQQERRARYDRLSDSEKTAYREAAEKGMDATVDACNDFIAKADDAILRDKLGELPEVISFSYIAKKYFGKSRNWLYQRINGYTVNGKKAGFTEAERKTFIDALDDISKMISTTSLNLN